MSRSEDFCWVKCESFVDLSFPVIWLVELIVHVSCLECVSKSDDGFVFLDMDDMDGDERRVVDEHGLRRGYIHRMGASRSMRCGPLRRNATGARACPGHGGLAADSVRGGEESSMCEREREGRRGVRMTAP